jgi:phosphate starvation-inducible membrane PsiE
MKPFHYKDREMSESDTSINWKALTQKQVAFCVAAIGLVFLISGAIFPAVTGFMDFFWWPTYVVVSGGGLVIFFLYLNFPISLLSYNLTAGWIHLSWVTMALLTLQFVHGLITVQSSDDRARILISFVFFILIWGLLHLVYSVNNRLCSTRTLDIYAKYIVAKSDYFSVNEQLQKTEYALRDAYRQRDELKQQLTQLQQMLATHKQDPLGLL